MAETAIARLLTHGVLLEPIAADVDAWFAELDRFVDVPLLDDGRPTPVGSCE